MKKLIKKNNYCEVCSKKLIKNIKLGNHPMCDDLIKVGLNKKAQLFPITLSMCENCLTVAQKIHINKTKLFPKNYHYRARLTKDVLNGQKNLVLQTEKFFGSLRKKNVLDIGANDCSLLNEFKKKGSKTIAVEPTNAIKDGLKYHTKYQSYFNKNISIKIKRKFKHIDFITFTNVFAHINNFQELLNNLKNLISEKTIVIVENHYLGSVLEKKQFDTFYSEHLRTYSFNSFLSIANNLKLNINQVQFPSRYGGNIRVFMSKRKKIINVKVKKKLLLKEKNFSKEFLKINSHIKKWKNKKKKLILDLNKKHGPLPAKAFPGRAAIILKLLGLNKQNISAIYEKPGSKKIGFYAPGTKIKILNENNLKNYNKNIPIINLAWHISKEIKKYLIKKEIKNKIINIVENKDFI